MEAYQWFLLGMMVAWTPGLVVLALMLRQRNCSRQRGHQQLAHTAKARATAARCASRQRPVDTFATGARAGLAVSACTAP